MNVYKIDIILLLLLRLFYPNCICLLTEMLSNKKVNENLSLGIRVCICIYAHIYILRTRTCPTVLITAFKKYKMEKLYSFQL